MKASRKLAISDVLRVGLKPVGDGFYSLLLEDEEFALVDVVGVVTGNFISENSNYAFLTLADGSGGLIRVKAWGSQVKLLVNPLTGELYGKGDVLRVIGFVRGFRGERYLVPLVIVRLNNPLALLVRELELIYEKAQKVLGHEKPKG